MGQFRVQQTETIQCLVQDQLQQRHGLLIAEMERQLRKLDIGLIFD